MNYADSWPAKNAPTHDPACPCADQEDDACTLISARTGRCISCRCVLIEQRLNEVRADEREKAAQRVKDLRKPSPTFHVAAMQNAYDTGVIEAIAAVRGES